MLTTPELIIALERRGILPPGDVARVRQLYENSPTEFVPRVLMKWLLSRKRLTAEQCELLLGIESDRSANELLDRILGVTERLELARDDGEFDEDTKEMPPGAEGDDALTLAPPGTAAFAGTPEGKAPLMPTPKPAPPAKSATPPQPELPATQYGDLFDELLGSAAGSQTLTPASVAKRKSRSGWDSTLVLAGGGGLLALLLLGGFFLWRISRQGGDDAFAAAEDSFHNGGYATALERYERFLSNYPQHRSVPAAVVHRGMSRLRLAVESGGESPRAVEVAEAELPAMAVLPEFSLVRTDSAVVLTGLLETLAKQAAAHPDATSIATARRVQSLVDKFVTEADFTATQRRQVELLMSTADRRVARAAAIAAAASAIRTAAVDRNLADAVEARAKLLREFPDAKAEPSLDEAMRDLADLKRNAVRYLVEDRAAATDDLPDVYRRKVTLAERRGEPVEKLRETCFAIWEGTLFALDAAEGRVLWTRAVGFDVDLPQFTSAGNEAVVIYDRRRRALLGLDSRTGAVRWRQADREFRQAVVDRTGIVATAADGLELLDAVTGRSRGKALFPQPLATIAPADPRERVRYAVAEADDLFVVSNSDFHCLQVVYLGHAPGAIRVAPLAVGPYLLLVENIGEQSRVRLFETGADGADLKPIDSRMLSGRVSLAPQASQRFVAVVTDRGAVAVFDLSGAKDRKPLDPIAQLSAADGEQSVVRHFLFQGTQLWLGGESVVRFELQPALGKLTPVRTFVQSRTTIQPPQRIGSLLVAATQRTNSSLPRSVAAYDAEEGRLQWETYLPQRLIGPPQVDARDSSLTCVTQIGSIFDVGAADEILDRPSAKFANNHRPDPNHAAVRLGDGATVFLSDYFAAGGNTADGSQRELLVLNPRDAAADTNAETRAAKAPAASDRTRSLPLPFAVGGEPAAFRDGILVPFENGQIHWLDPQSGSGKAEPVQLPTAAGKRFAFSRLAVLGDDFYAADGGDRLHHFALEEQPHRQLIRRGQGAQAVHPLGRKTAAVGKTVFVLDVRHELLACEVPAMRWGESWPLTSSEQAWQPAIAGSRAFVLDRSGDKTSLLACDEAGRFAWQTPLKHPCYAPVTEGDSLFVADAFGEILRLNAADGKILARKHLQVPLAAEPAIAGNQLVVVTQAGELWWIDKP